jgi:hypothetical protein
MARPGKVGLDYFPLDTAFFQDIKIRKLIKYQGCQAIPVYTLLLCYIYQNGYYLMWDEELPFIISDTTGYEEGYVREVIICSRKVGLFSDDLFEKHKVLTSKGIQERYMIICRQAKRKFVIDEFSIVSSEETRVNSEETGVYSEFSTQSKVKESKEKKSRGEESKESSPSDFENFEIPDFVKAEQQAFKDDLKNNPPELRGSPLTLDEYEQELRKSRQFIETACMTRKVTEQEFSVALRDFFAEKKVLGHKTKSQQDIMQHFLNWLTIWKSKKDQQAAKGDPSKGKIQRAVETTTSAADRIRQQRANQ